MNNIENRVVEMKFDNAQFEQAVAKTMQTLDKFKEKLNFEDSGKGLDKLGQATDSYTGTLSSVGSALETLQSKFGSLSSVGERVFSALTSAATGFIKNGINQAISGVMEGGMSRAMNLEQAKFQLEGILGSAEEVNRVIYNDILPELQGTPFSLDQAAVVMGQLAASGKTTSAEVQQGTRAIAGAAAMTNSSFADMGRIFTKVAGNGRVMGDTLQEMSSRGLNAAADMGKVFNMTEAEVREAVTAGKISYDMFAEAMDKLYGAQAKKSTTMYTGALEDLRAALARIGAEPMAVKLEFLRDAFNALVPAVDAVNAVFKPFTDSSKALVDAEDGTKKYAKEFNGSLAQKVQRCGWAFQSMFVQLDEGHEIMRYSEENIKSLGGTIREVTDENGNVTKELVDQFGNVRDAGEAVLNPAMYRITTAAAQSFVNVVAALGKLLGAVGKGIIEAFPKVTLDNVADLIEGIQKFTKALIFSEPVLKSIQAVVRALFTPLGLIARVLVIIAKVVVQVVKLVYSAVKPVAKVLISSLGLAGDLFSGFGKLVDQAAQNVTWFATKIFGAIKAFVQFLKLDVIFSKVSDGVSKFSTIMQGAGEKLYGFMSGFSGKMHDFGKRLYELLRLKEVAEAIGRLKDRFHELMQTTGHLGFDKLVAGIKGMVDHFKLMSISIAPLKNAGQIFKDFGDKLASMIPTDKIIDGIDRFASFVVSLGYSIADLAAPIINKAVEGLAAFVSVISNAIKYLRDAGVVQGAINLITEGFRKLSGFIPQLMGFKNFGDMLDGIKSKIKGFIETFKEFIEAIVGGGKNKAQNFGKNVTDSFKGIGDSKMVKRLSGFGDIVHKLGDALKGAAGGIGDKLKAFYEALEAGDKQKIVASLSMLAIAFSYIRTIAKVKSTVEKAGTVIRVFGGLGDLLSEAGKSFKKAGTAISRMTTLIGVTTSLLILAAAMSILSRMNMEDLVQGGIAAIGALIALAISLALLNSIKVDPANKKKIIEMGGAMAAIGAAVLMISTSMEKIAGVYDSHTPMEFLAIIGTLAGMMVAFGLLAFEFSKLDKMEANLKSAGLSMIAIGTAIKLMVSSIEKIGSMDVGILLKGGGVVTALFIFMGILAKVTSTNTTFGDVGSSILKIAASLLVLWAAIELYAMMDPMKFAVGLGKLGLTLLALLGIFSLFGEVAGPKNAGGLVVASIAVIAFAGALAILSAIPFTNLLQGILGIALAIGALGVVMAVLSFLGVGMLAVGAALALLGVAFLAAGAGALLLTTALATLVPLLLLLSNVDTEMLQDGLKVIKMIAKKLAGAFLSLAGGVLAFGAALLVAAIATVVLAVGVNALGAGFAVCGVGLLFLAGGLATIALVIDAFFGGELLSKIGGAFESFGNTVLGGLGGLVSKVKGFFTKDEGKKTVQAYQDGMTEAVEGDTDFSTAWGNKMTEAKDAITNKKGEFTGVFGDLMTESGAEITNNSGAVTGPIDSLGVDMNSILSGDISDASSLFGSLPGEAGSALSSKKGELSGALNKVFGSKDLVPTKKMKANMSSAATESAKNFSSSVTNQTKNVVKSTTDMMNKAQKPAKDSKKAFTGYGTDAASGYRSGINSMVKKVADAAAAMVRKAKAAAKKAQDSNSPSKEFAKLGRWADEGYIVGLQSLAGKVANTAGGVVEGGLSAATDAMNQISDVLDMDMDFTPTITPVVDLSEVRQSAAGINSILGGDFGLTTPYSGFVNAQMAAAAFQNGPDPAEFEAINKLAKEIGSMNETMNARQLVNNIHIEGSEDPDAFADRLTRRFRLNARTI